MLSDSRVVIYGIGANNGCNLPYYLLKADKVVAVEANPILASHIRDQYQHDIEAGKLVVENCVVTARDESGDVDFYVHKCIDKLSQFPRPAEDLAGNYRRLRLPSKTLVSIIKEHGHPYYIKLDIEHYDARLLEALFENGIYPEYLSAEYHSADVFLITALKGGYSGFKLVDGRSVSSVYASVETKGLRDHVVHRISFPAHSAGPFGDDVLGDWYGVDAFVGVLGMTGTGWKDIHATRYPVDRINRLPDWKQYLDQTVGVADLGRYLAGRFMRALARRFYIYS